MKEAREGEKSMISFIQELWRKHDETSVGTAHEPGGPAKNAARTMVGPTRTYLKIQNGRASKVIGASVHVSAILHGAETGRSDQGSVSSKASLSIPLKKHFNHTIPDMNQFTPVIESCPI